MNERELREENLRLRQELEKVERQKRARCFKCCYVHSAADGCGRRTPDPWVSG